MRTCTDAIRLTSATMARTRSTKLPAANVDDYRWMETVMREAHPYMDAISLHYYTIPGEFWTGKGPATGFSEQEWFATMKKALHMDELITRHSAIMDQYDPNKRIGLIVDEWGTWFDVEPGTNPGFLYQQNTIRDALVAGLTLNIFHEHNDRVVMANIAQIVNVLQSVILTEGEKMILTPTYHVFDMYKVHQDAERLATHHSGADYEMNGEKIPQVSVTASRDEAGKIHVSLCNVSHAEQSDVKIQLRGLSGAVKQIVGRQLAADSLDAHNTFESPEVLKPAAFTAFEQEGDVLRAKLAPMSVTVLEITAE